MPINTNLRWLMLAGVAALPLIAVGCSSGQTNNEQAYASLADAQSNQYGTLSEEQIVYFNDRLREMDEALARGYPETAAGIRATLVQSAMAYESALINSIGDRSNPRARATAAAMLGFLGKGTAALTLAQIMSNPDEPSFMRNRASIGLMQLGSAINTSVDREAVMALIAQSMLPSVSSVSVRMHAVPAYARAYSPEDGDSLQPLIDVVTQDFANEVRVQALTELGRLGVAAEGAVPAMAAALRDPNIVVKSAAAVALGSVPSPRAYEALYGATDDESGRVRREAVFAIAGQKTINPDGVRERVIRALGDTDETVRASAATAARHVGGDDLVRPLLSSLSDTSSNVRLEAINSLGEMIPSEGQVAAIHLVWQLDDGNPQIRTAALSSLKRITGESIGGDSEAWRGWFYAKYPTQLDPDVVYKGQTKPRYFSDGPATAGARRTNAPNQRNTRTTRNTRSTRNTRNTPSRRR